MKYAIQLVDDQDNVEYVSSSKGKPYHTTDLHDAALFVQEPSAVKLVEQYRRLGYEPKGSVYSVVKVRFVVEATIEVARPKPKVGFVLQAKLPKGDEVFYTAAKKSQVTYSQGDLYYAWGHLNSASVFESELKAKVRLQELVEYNELELARAKREAAAYVFRSNGGYAIDRTQEYAGRVKKYEETLDVLQFAKVLKIGS